MLTALPSLLYQNSGYIQFGYRFSLDYFVFLVLLIAIGGRRSWVDAWLKPVLREAGAGVTTAPVY